ncbi:hypothetical protein FA13DRAFT_1395267 [Coprinellus micaceus]|uniref:Uncharacterized protein n=1 Tax=Coprinellus micaceus TaxID=71717 RepID=A0A4Y7SQC0_COPMI|nr:hypothetical protein FA13DRAFT_1395267 [Coprinellus micaceus]
MALTCHKRLDLDPLVFSRNLNVLMDVFRQFLAHGDPIITSAFRAHAFVRATAACWTTIYHRLRVKTGKKQYRRLHNMALQLQEWSAFDGLSPLKSMRQSIQGGLLSISWRSFAIMLVPSRRQVMVSFSRVSKPLRRGSYLTLHIHPSSML